ncbi:MAG TPA: phage tail tape measure protein [Rhodocyclaceae bacterium]
MGDRLRLEVVLAAIDKATGPLRVIMKGSGDAARALKGMKDQLKALESQQKLISAFKDTDKAAAITANTFKAAQERVRQLKAEMAGSPEPAQKMVRALAEAEKEVEKLRTRHASLMTTQQRLFQQMRSGGIDVGNLAAHSRDLSVQQNEAARSVEKLRHQLESQNKVIARMHAARAAYDKSMGTASKLRSAGTGALMAGGAINAAVALPVLAYAKAEDSATQLKVAMLGAGGALTSQYAEINRLAEQLGNKLPGTTSDYQDMMTMLVRQGMPAEKILGGLGKATAYLAVQLKMAPTAAAEFAAELQHATRTTDAEMMQLMDVIQRTYYIGVNQTDMLQGYAKLSPALSILRQEGAGAAKALAPLIAMTVKSGMAGEASGNAFRKIFQLSMDAKKVAKANKASGLGLDFTDGKGEFGGIEKMYAQLEKLKAVNTQKRLAVLRTIFGDDAETLQALSIMIDRGMAGYKDVQASLDRQADIQIRVNEQLNTLKNLWDAASGTFTNALVALGESIAPDLHETARWLGEVAEKTQGWMKDHPTLAAGMMKIAKWAGIIALVFGGLLVGAGALLVPFAMLNFAFGAIGLTAGGAAAGLWAFLLPVLKIGAAFAAGYALGMLIDEAISALVSRIAGYKTNLGGFVFDIIQAFKNGEWSKIGGWMLAGFEAGLDLLSGGLYSKVKSIAGKVVTAAKEALGIKSPSRVFHQIGGFTMQGFEQGILGGQDGPIGALQSMTKRFAAAGAGLVVGGSAMAMPSFDTRPPIAGALGGAAAPMIVTINLYPPAGSSTQGMAEMVAAEIAKLERSRSTRARSRLTDEA